MGYGFITAGVRGAWRLHGDVERKEYSTSFRCVSFLFCCVCFCTFNTHTLREREREKEGEGGRTGRRRVGRQFVSSSHLSGYTLFGMNLKIEFLVLRPNANLPSVACRARTAFDTLSKGTWLMGSCAKSSPNGTKAVRIFTNTFVTQSKYTQINDQPSEAMSTLHSRHTTQQFITSFSQHIPSPGPNSISR
jgi:hypothetical protein